MNSEKTILEKIENICYYGVAFAMIYAGIILTCIYMDWETVLFYIVPEL